MSCSLCRLCRHKEQLTAGGRATARNTRRRGQQLGSLSGFSNEKASLIPFEVVHWGISVEGDFPLQG